MSPITFKEYKNRHVQFIKIWIPLHHTITISAFEFNTYLYDTVQIGQKNLGTATAIGISAK